MKNIIAIVGPTASGKSSLGIYLGKKLGGEVISADSRQVYKGLNIGTGKVTKREMAQVPHHLLDVASPKRRFTVDHFTRKAHRAISLIYQTKKIPIVVGGTGLYVDVLLGRMDYADVPPNEPLRKRLGTKAAGQLFAMLKKKDPRRAGTIEPRHKRRLIRALEIAEALGKNPIPAPKPNYEVLWLGLSPGEATLKKNIHKRLKARMRAGMEAEAKRLHKGGLSYARMDELGLEYRFLAKLLRKELTREEFLQQLETAIWQYSRRQIRWFKRNPDIRKVGSNAEALRLAKAFLSR